MGSRWVPSYVHFTVAGSSYAPPHYLHSSVTTAFPVPSLVRSRAFRIAFHCASLCVPRGSRWVPSYVSRALAVLAIIANAESSFNLSPNDKVCVQKTKDKEKKALCQK